MIGAQSFKSNQPEWNTGHDRDCQPTTPATMQHTRQCAAKQYSRTRQHDLFPSVRRVHGIPGDLLFELPQKAQCWPLSLHRARWPRRSIAVMRRAIFLIREMHAACRETVRRSPDRRSNAWRSAGSSRGNNVYLGKRVQISIILNQCFGFAVRLAVGRP